MRRPTPHMHPDTARQTLAQTLILGGRIVRLLTKSATRAAHRRALVASGVAVARVWVAGRVRSVVDLT